MENDSVMVSGGWLGQLGVALQELNWDNSDEIVVKIGGTCVSGIDVGEDYNKKWQSPKGTRKYNKEAFIVIENATRRPFESSKPPSDNEVQ